MFWAIGLVGCLRASGAETGLARFFWHPTQFLRGGDHNQAGCVYLLRHAAICADLHRYAHNSVRSHTMWLMQIWKRRLDADLQEAPG